MTSILHQLKLLGIFLEFVDRFSIKCQSMVGCCRRWKAHRTEDAFKDLIRGRHDGRWRWCGGGAVGDVVERAPEILARELPAAHVGVEGAERR